MKRAKTWPKTIPRATREKQDTAAGPGVRAEPKAGLVTVPVVLCLRCRLGAMGALSPDPLGPSLGPPKGFSHTRDTQKQLEALAGLCVHEVESVTVIHA